MELELGLKITRARDGLTPGIQFSKKYGGPLFTSTETETMFVLVGHLPGFKKDEIRIDINESGVEIAISGQTCVQEMAMVSRRLRMKESSKRHFRKVFNIPGSVILDEIKAWFHDEETTLTILMPKSIKGIQGIQIEEVREVQAEEEKLASTEKTQADGAQTSDMNDGVRSQLDEMVPKIDSVTDSSEGETSELNHFITPGKAGDQEETDNSNGQTSEKQKETSEGDRSERGPIVQSKVDWIAKQDRGILNSMTTEPDQLHQPTLPGEKDDRDARPEIQYPNAMEVLERPPEVEDRQTEEPGEASISENPKPAYEIQENPSMFKDAQLDGAAPNLSSTYQKKEDEDHRAEAAGSSNSGRTPNNQDMLNSLKREREKRERYEGIPYTVIAGSAFLVSLTILIVHLHRSKKHN